MAMTVKKHGIVIAYEPDIEIFNTLNDNLITNMLNSICRTYQLKIGELDRRGCSLMTTIDNAVKENELKMVNIMKVDVDGGDYDVLLGARETLKVFHPLLIVEMTKFKNEIFELLANVGYKYIIDMNGNPVSKNKWPPNIIASMNSINISIYGYFKNKIE